MTTYPPPGYPQPIQHTPLGWVFAMVATLVLIGVCCLGILWAFASRGDTLTALLYAGGGLLVLGVVWLMLALVGGIAYRTYLLSALAPVLIALTAGLLLLQIPQDLGWRMSKPALERAAAECTDSRSDTRIGLYTFDYIRKTPEGCTFSLAGSGLGPDGFAYIPSGAAPEVPAKALVGDHYTALGGPWFTFDHFIDPAA
ncbi:MAG: hypothetical protein JWN03_9033 [Nocardia sp.]|uniref:hypothetical protein n=1 Tax=Nocardia sp. TaxID=1821 RepID=UPI0026096011|nr:hypothetical protein [Nocardia sp.]MCU1648758.1 hypothetical protein [Nocardia sp.]